MKYCNGHIRQVHEDLLLLFQLHHQFLRGCAGNQEDRFFQLIDEFLLRRKQGRIGLPEIRNTHQLLLDRKGRRHQVQSSSHGTLQGHIQREQSIDLVGALINSIDAAIAIGSRDAVFRAVSISTMDLYTFIHRKVQHLAAKHLQHGTFDGIFLRRPQQGFMEWFAFSDQLPFFFVDPTSRSIQGRIPHIQLDRHLSQLVLNGPKGSDRLFELLSGLGILYGGIQGHLRPTQSSCTKFQATDIQNVERDLVAFSDLTQYILHRYFTVLEIQLHRGRSLDAHFLLFGTLREAFHPALQNESRELGSIDLGKHGIDLRKSAVGDPTFLSVEDIMLPIRTQRGSGFRTQCIAPAVGFGESVCTGPLTRDQFGNVSLLLILRSKVENGQRTDARMCRNRYRERIARTQELIDNGRRNEILSESAVLFRKRGG